MLIKDKLDIQGNTRGEIWVEKRKNGVLYEKVCLEKNAVVPGASVLAARLFKQSNEPANGVYALAVGTGDPLWDLQNPPAAAGTEDQLFAEIDRVAIKTSKFITPISGLVSATPTNIVDFEFEFPEGRAVGTLVELGIYGGDATLTLNSGTLVTYKTFPVLNKPSDSSFTFIYRLTF